MVSLAYCAYAELQIRRSAQLPIYAIGIGEGINDLRHLDCEEFVNAIL